MGMKKNNTVFLSELQAAFIQRLSVKIIEQLSEYPAAIAFLTTEIYRKKEIKTILERICYSLYRKYIEDKDENAPAEVIVSKKYLEQLNLSQYKIFLA